MSEHPQSRGIDSEGISPRKWISQTEAHGSSYRRLADKIARHYPLTGGRVLDFGCGNGILLSLLAKRWPRTVSLEGTDIDRELIDWATKNFASDNLGYKDLTDVESNRQQPDCDLVISTFVCHHWDDPHRFFAELFRYAKPGGSVFVEDINPHGLYSYLHASMLYRLLFRPTSQDFYGYRESRQSAFPADRLESVLKQMDGIRYRLECHFGRITIHATKEADAD